MTNEETVFLTRYVRACCPQQAIDEYTPDAWHDIIGDLELVDCRAAVVAIVRRQPFVAPAEIRAQVRATYADDAGPQSNACRARNCRDCVWSWCIHDCHPGRPAVMAPGEKAPAINREHREPADAHAWAAEARRRLEADHAEGEAP